MFETYVSICKLGLVIVPYDDVFLDFRFLRMRDFDLSKAKDEFLNYLNWRESFGVDKISKVQSRQTLTILYTRNLVFKL